jgi:hypothetical protein
MVVVMMMMIITIIKSDNSLKVAKQNIWIYKDTIYNVTDLINALPGNSSVNTVQHATIEEAVFSVDPTDAPID